LTITSVNVGYHLPFREAESKPDVGQIVSQFFEKSSIKSAAKRPVASDCQHLLQAGVCRSAGIKKTRQRRVLHQLL
jgi:hypothetical protein